MVGNGSDFVDDRQPSPYEVFQQISEEAVRVASEAIHGVYNGSNSGENSPVERSAQPPRHRRVQSESLSSESSGLGFQRWKSQMKRAFSRGRSLKEEVEEEEKPRGWSSFNPEVMANQKRQWYQVHSKNLDLSTYKEPASLFEHLVIVGLPSDTNLKTVEDVFARRKTRELQMANYEGCDTEMSEHRGLSYPAFEAQILFKYPPGKKLAIHPKDLPAFCFPEGVKAHLMQRTPSMSDLNEVVYGLEHLGRDDLSFIFSLKGSDNATLYGVCLHVHEIVQRSPGIIGVSSPFSRSSGGFGRFLASAPRCYCVLTRVPFFELHYEMLNSIVTQERLNRITQFVSEMNITDSVPSSVGAHSVINENGKSHTGRHSMDWTAFAIPVDSAAALTAAAAGIISDDEVKSFSFKLRESDTPESISTSKASDNSQAKETNKERRRRVHQFDDNASETFKIHCDEFERLFGSYVNGNASLDVGMYDEHRESSYSLFSEKHGFRG